MVRKQTSTQIPTSMQTYYQKITQLTDVFCQKTLNEEYRELVRLATAMLCRKRPSPLMRGDLNTWACAIVYAIGSVNFLFDKSQIPYVSPAQLTQAFQVNQSTASNKAKQIQQQLKIGRFDHRWMLPSRIKDSPSAWYIMINGFFVDARTLPLDMQQIAVDKGLIPYVHGQLCL